MTAILDKTRVTPLLPHRTADVVRLVREVVQELESAGILLPEGENLVAYMTEKVVACLAEFPQGLELLMIDRVEIEDPDVIEVLPKSRISLRCIAANSGFHSVQQAVAHRSRRDIGSLEGKMVTLLALLVVTNSDESRGQLSHPDALREEFEAVANTCASIKKEHLNQFLLNLEAACSQAHRAGGSIAAVAVRDTVVGDTCGVAFDPFHARSDESYQQQLVRQYGQATCFRIDVRQLDSPL